MSEPILRILAEPQTDPQKCRFSFEQPLYEGGSFLFKTLEETQGSELARALLEVPGVIDVFAAPTHLIVTKNVSEAWQNVGRQIGVAIRQAVASGKPLIDPGKTQTLPTEQEIRDIVQKVLEEKVNPAVAGHGGYIELLDVRHNDVYVKMGGGCQGCAQSSATLKQGVEGMLREAIPLLGSVYDTTDHAAGTNPYYQSHGH